MSTSVDNRIVSMRFDNKQFESGTKQTMSTLDKLKEKLNLPGASKGLENIGAASKRVSFDGISQGVEAVKVKFSALQVVAITALTNITNSAVNAGKELVRSLTIDPIKDGMDDYNRKLTSIQTITNATGKSIKEVDSYFKELDIYADKTIYNLDDMTSSLAKFTNAGVGLDKSVPAIKGIANMVALAGQDAGAAQIAMYNLSQSIAGGFLTTMDYKSLNLANVATREWKDQMIAGAIAAGTLKESAKGMYMIKGAKEAVTGAALFNEQLSTGWATTDVLLNVLGKYGDANSDIGAKAQAAAQEVKSFSMMMDTLKAAAGTGWTDTFEILVGNLEEAKALFTPLSETIGGFLDSMSKARNDLLGEWKDLGGRTALIEAFVNSFKFLMSIIKPIKEAFRDIFPAMTGKRLFEITTALRDFTAKLTISDTIATNIKNSFKGLFAVLDIGIKIFKTLAGVVGLVFKSIFPGTGALLSLTASLGDFLTYVNDSIDRLGVMQKVFKVVGYVLDNIRLIISQIEFDIVVDKLKTVSEKLSPILEFVKNIIGSVYDFFMQLFPGVKVYAATVDEAGESISEVSSITDKLRDRLSKIIDVISKVAKTVKSVLTPVFSFIKDKLDELSVQDIGAVLTGVGLLKFANAISKGISSIDNILSSFSNILDEVGNTLKAFQMKVKATAILKIAVALAILAAALIALSFIDLVELGISLGAITVMLIELVVALKVLNKMDDIKSISLQLVALGISLLLLVKAVKTLSAIDPLALLQGVGALATLMAMIVVFIKLTKGGDLAASTTGLIGFSVGITILAGALFILGSIKFEKLVQGVGALATLMVMIGLFIKLTKGGDLAASAGGLIGFSVGIAILSGSLFMLGSIKFEKLLQGVGALSTLMVMIGLFIKLTKGGDLAASAGGLIGFSVGIVILSGALFMLGSIDPLALLQGVGAIATLMTTIGLFIKLTKGGDLAASAGGLIGFAAGIAILSGAVALLAAINPDKIKQGIGAIAALITVIGLFIKLTKGGDLAASAAGLIGFAAGLAILAGVIAILSALDTGKLMMASGAIGVMMLSLAAFATLTNGVSLIKAAGILIAFSAGIWVLVQALLPLASLDPGQTISASAAIAIAMASIIVFTKLINPATLILCAAGLIVFSGAMMVLGKVLETIGNISIENLVKSIAALAAIFVVLGVGTLLLTPLIPAMLGLAAAIVLFGGACLAVGAGILLFSTGLTALSLAGTAGVATIVAMVSAIISLIPLTLATLAQGIIAFAVVIGNGAPAIGEAMVKILTAIIDTIITVTPQIMECLQVLITSLLTMLVNTVPDMVDAGMKLILGILQGIAANIAAVVAAGIDVIIQFILGVASKIPDIIDTAFKVIISFINGLADAIRNNRAEINSACKNLIDAIAESVTGFAGEIKDIGKNIISGIIEGFKNMGSTLVDAAKGVVGGAVDGVKNFLGIHSPSRVFAEIGKYSALGMAVGLEEYSGKVSNAANDVGSEAVDSLKNAMSNMSDIVNSNVDMNPTIRPVIDLSDVTAGAGEINSLFNKRQGITVSNNSNRAASISNNMKASKEIQNDSISQGHSQTLKSEITPKTPMTLQLVLQNGKAIAEYIVDDIDGLLGNKTQITGRMVGI